MTTAMQKKYIKVNFTKSGKKHLLKSHGFPSNIQEYDMPVDNFDMRSAFLSNLVINSKVVRSHERDFSSINHFLKSSFKKRSKSVMRGHNTTSFNLNHSRANKSMVRSKSNTSKNSLSGHSLYTFQPYGNFKSAVEDTETFIKSIIRILTSYVKKANQKSIEHRVAFGEGTFKLQR